MRAPTRPSAMPMTEDALDRGLERLADAGPELDNGLSNHAPMVIEALHTLDRDAAIASWVDRYLPGTRPWPAPQRAIADLDSGPLGAPQRATDWRRFFLSQLEHTPWRAVLQSAVDRLAPGAVSDATHGLIRVGHAVRSLAESVTPARTHELANALAVWASTYQTLGVGTGDPECLPALEAVQRLPRLPAAQRRNHGTIVAALAPLAEFRAFDRVRNLIDPRESPATLAEACAQLYLANARDPLTCIVFIHGVTSMTAIDHLWPHLEADARTILSSYGWQAAAALYAAYGTAAPTATDRAVTVTPAALVDAAVEHGDEHVIKLTEACMHQYRRRPSAVFLAVVQHALGTLRPVR